MFLHTSIDRSKFDNNEYRETDPPEQPSGFRKQKRRFMVKSSSSRLTAKSIKPKKTVRFALDHQDLVKENTLPDSSSSPVREKDVKICPVSSMPKEKVDTKIKRSQSNLMTRKERGKFKNGSLSSIKKSFTKMMQNQPNFKEIKRMFKNSQPSVKEKFRFKYPRNNARNKSILAIKDKNSVNTSGLRKFQYGYQSENEPQMSHIQESRTYDSRAKRLESHNVKKSLYKPVKNKTDAKNHCESRKLTPEFYKALLKHGTFMRENIREKGGFPSRAEVHKNEYSTQSSVERSHQSAFFNAPFNPNSFRKSKLKIRKIRPQTGRNRKYFQEKMSVTKNNFFN
ncbi:unnamed protein product [Moneuplotes crassus]|uniref:Uncharacterized protein n=1 Tax=Euplotes crassus TaxID=5936 RepID=A0AAD1UIN8_EUPCR|nr:unnamed protein product [Moneuplotes crassus]